MIFRSQHMTLFCMFGKKNRAFKNKKCTCLPLKVYKLWKQRNKQTDRYLINYYNQLFSFIIKMHVYKALPCLKKCICTSKFIALRMTSKTFFLLKCVTLQYLSFQKLLQVIFLFLSLVCDQTLSIPHVLFMYRT